MGDPPALSHSKTNPPGSVGSTPGIDAASSLSQTPSQVPSLPGRRPSERLPLDS